MSKQAIRVRWRKEFKTYRFEDEDGKVLIGFTDKQAAADHHYRLYIENARLKAAPEWSAFENELARRAEAAREEIKTGWRQEVITARVVRDKADEKVRKLKAIVDPLNRLRESEGAAVTISCPNPNFNGPGETIIVEDDWGDGWVGHTFAAETLGEALAAAEAAKAEKEDKG